MLFFLVSFFPFVLLLSKSLPLEPLPQWASETRLVSILLFQEVLSFLAPLLERCRPVRAGNLTLPSSLMSPGKGRPHRVENVEELAEMSVLDLPELALDCILGRLSPAGLCNMAAVCSSLKERCRSDHLWEKHMKEKWGRVIGNAARREWKLYLASTRDSAVGAEDINRSKKWNGVLSCLWPISWLNFRIDSGNKHKSPLPDDSIMSWYRSLESGKLWFPAQVYNREHGHVGFMLSCYDAEVSYDCSTDTFHARYPPHGRRMMIMEEGVQWDRLRAPPVNTPAYDLHISDCLSDLRAGDHIEIQWRRNKEFPYGWWYGVIGHLESCDGNELLCHCHLSDTVILEFNQYTPGSRWRRASINRKAHREEGNETDGFYGGIRKLQSKDEISKWRQLWPKDVLV
uniref:F-box domain-containing protein n=1 Tax=Musa acuminata subsp. malaccensis TaxID=214687 RepID=A0A804IDU6_MUSAM|nr:PREDICTED: F-box protein At2g32560-like [Musa acuminata subsp. malaccensis]